VGVTSSQNPILDFFLIGYPIGKSLMDSGRHFPFKLDMSVSPSS
jgi:hypothetical protein